MQTQSLLVFIHVILQAGRTPIMEAARKGHKEVIKVLLRFGADILLTSHEVMF
jgi:ankyrin repeat protein